MADRYWNIAARYRRRTETLDTAPTHVEWADLPETAAALLVARPDREDCVLVLRRGLTAGQAQIAALVADPRRAREVRPRGAGDEAGVERHDLPRRVLGEEESGSEVLAAVMLDEVLRRETEMGGMPTSDTS